MLPASDHIEYSARSSRYNMLTVIKFTDILTQVGSSCSTKPFKSTKSNHLYQPFGLNLCNFTKTWEPSAAKVTKSYSRRLPAFERYCRETKFLLFKSTISTNLKLRTFPRVFRVPQSNRPGVPEL